MPTTPFIQRSKYVLLRYCHIANFNFCISFLCRGDGNCGAYALLKYEDMVYEPPSFPMEDKRTKWEGMFKWEILKNTNWEVRQVE